MMTKKATRMTKPKKQTNRQIIEEWVANGDKQPKGNFLDLSDPRGGEEDTGASHYSASEYAEKWEKQKWGR